MADLQRNANITKSNSEIKEETLFGGVDNSFLMDVSADGHAELIRELTDASRNKGAYAMREAISNAIDATIKAGRADRPVEVFVPGGVGSHADAATLADKLLSRTPGVRCVTVTDHGTGMSADELRENFAQYGNSDKRGSGLIGSKGLGAKAPLACSDYFEVESTKDGRRVKMALWREEDGNYARIASDRKVSAESGTVVRIPVMSEDIRSEMEKTARQMASWSTEVRIELAGESESLAQHRLGRELGRTYQPIVGENSSYRYWYSSASNDSDNYVFMGTMPLGEDMADVWRYADTLGDCVSVPAGFHDSAEIDIDLMGARYPLLRDGSVGSSLSMSGQTPEYIVGCRPGYLNFTVSRDDIKEDDAWRRFVSALREAFAEFDQWPAVIRHIAGMESLADRITFMRRKSIAIVRRGGQNFISQQGDEHAISDEEMRSILSAPDTDGVITDLSEVLVADIDDVPAEGEGITVMGVYDGRMHAMTVDSNGFANCVETKMAVKDIRSGVARAARKSNLCTLTVPFNSASYWCRNKVTDLRVVVLTHMGDRVDRIATGDRVIRKALADGSRPADVSILYVLCEGEFRPDASVLALLAQFPKGHETHRYDNFLRECRTGISEQEREARERRREQEREAERQRDIRRVLTVRPRATPQSRAMDLYDMVEEGIDTMNSPRTGYSCTTYCVDYETVDLAERSDDDLLAIKNGEQNPGALMMAYRILERAGKVSGYSRIVLVPGMVAREWGLYDRLLGKRDVLCDSEGVLEGVAGGAVQVDDAGRVRLDTDAAGLAAPDAASAAAVLLSDERISPQALRSVYALVKDTGDAALDGLLEKYDFGHRMDGGRSWYYSTGSGHYPRTLRLVPTDGFSKAMGHTYEAARRLSEAWDSGIGALVTAARNDRLPDGMTVDDVKAGLRAIADA